jgi:hypothetical protein
MIGEPNQGKHLKLNRRANSRCKLQLEGTTVTKEIRIREAKNREIQIIMKLKGLSKFLKMIFSFHQEAMITDNLSSSNQSKSHKSWLKQSHLQI